MTPKLTHNERRHIKLAKELTRNQRQQEALADAVLIAKTTHKPVLRKMLAQLESKYTETTDNLEVIERDLKWEVLLLKPLLDHIQLLSAVWQGSSHSQEAQNHLDQLAKFGCLLCRRHDNNQDPALLIKKLEALENSAPSDISEATEASMFYPMRRERMELAGEAWQTLLKEMSPAKSKSWINDDVHGFSAWLDYCAQIGIITKSVLDGDLRKIEESLEPDYVSTIEFNAVSQFAVDNFGSDAYVEDKAARKAFKQANLIEKSMPVATTSRSRRL